MNFKNNLLKSCEKFDIEKFLEKNEVEYQIKNGQIVVKKCPECEDERWKLYMNEKTKLFYCFICNFGKNGNLAHFISKVLNISYENALQKILNIEEISKFENGLLPPLNSASIEKGKAMGFQDPAPSGEGSPPPVALPVTFLNLLPFDKNGEHSNDLLEAYSYLIKRGLLEKKYILNFDLKFDIKSKRIIFPLKYRGEYIGWQGRDITGRCEVEKGYPKSLTGPIGFKKSKALYNYDRVYNKEFITIVEGPIDAIKSYLCNPVALFGKNLSIFQKELIRQMPNLKKIIIALDPGEYDSMYGIAKELNIFYEVKILELKDKDPGDCLDYEIYSLLSEARSFDSRDRLGYKFKK